MLYKFIVYIALLVNSHYNTLHMMAVYSNNQVVWFWKLFVKKKRELSILAIHIQNKIMIAIDSIVLGQGV